MMIDLHTHTKYSDGTWTVEQLLENAQKAGIEILSITDHDTAKAHIQLQNERDIRKKFDGKIIIGAELNCVFDGIKIEVLAYNFDLNPVEKWLEDYYTEEKNRQRLIDEFKDLVQLCNKKNIQIEDNLQYNPDNEYPVDVIYNSIVKFESNKKYFNEEQWRNKEIFYRTCTVDRNFILYRDFSKQTPSIEEISKLIHDNGGKIFLAHLFKYYLDNHIEYLDKLCQTKFIDGVEVYHSSFSEEEIEELKKYCINKNMLMSGGSDCHGERKKERKIGVGYGNLNIDKKIIEDWIFK